MNIITRSDETKKNLKFKWLASEEMMEVWCSNVLQKLRKLLSQEIIEKKERIRHWYVISHFLYNSEWSVLSSTLTKIKQHKLKEIFFLPTNTKRPMDKTCTQEYLIWQICIYLDDSEHPHLQTIRADGYNRPQNISNLLRISFVKIYHHANLMYVSGIYRVLQQNCPYHVSA